MGGGADAEICTFCLGGSGDRAGKGAQRSAAAHATPLPSEIEALDGIVAALAGPVAKPGVFLRRVLAMIRLREPKDVARVLDALS